MSRARFEYVTVPTTLPPTGTIYIFADSADNRLKTIDSEGVIRILDAEQIVDIEVIKTSVDVNPALPFVTYLIDASAGHITMKMPDVSLDDGDWFNFMLSANGNHAAITTVGGTQLINGQPLIELSTEQASVQVKANGLDGYDILSDQRVYYRMIQVTGNLDLSVGYQSGAIYECASPIAAQIIITIPDTTINHEGLYAKFILATDNGTSVRVITESGEVIGGVEEQVILEPFKGFEIADEGGVGYIVTQDSRPSASNVAINFYPTGGTSVLEPTYAGVLETERPDEETFTTPAVTSIDPETPDFLGYYINDNKALIGDLADTSINAYAFAKLSAVYNRSVRIKFQYFEYDYGTNTLNTTPLSASSYSGVIANVAAFEEYFVGGEIPANTWAETATVGKLLVIGLYAFKSAAGGDNPAIDIKSGGNNTSRTTINVPVASVNHATLGGVVPAAAGVPDGHIDDQPQTIAGSKTFAADLIVNPGILTIGNDESVAARLGQLFETNSSDDYGGAAFATWSTTISDCAMFELNKSASNTPGTHALVADGENLGFVQFRGSDGGQFRTGALIASNVDGTPSEGAVKGDLSFYTNSSVLNFRIAADGSLYAANLSTISGQADVQYNTSTKEFGYVSSSLFFKENIRLEVDTSWLHKLVVKKYDRKDGSKFDEVGLIVEDLYIIKPDMCALDVYGRPITYSNTGLVPYLLKEAQEQKKLIQELRKDIDELKQMLT